MQEIEFLSNPEAGELLIGSGSAFVEGFVLAVIDRLSQTLSACRLSSHAGRPDWRSTTSCASGASSWLSREIPSLIRRMISMPKCCSKSRWWWRRARKIRGYAAAGSILPILVNEPWTWSPPGTVVDRLVVQAFRAAGLEPPRAAVYTDAINVRIRLAATRGFLIVVPASMLSLPARHEGCGDCRWSCPRPAGRWGSSLSRTGL